MSAEGPPDGYLFDLYRTYIGEPDGRTDVYVGFGLFFGGIVLGVVALALFLWASTHPARSASYLELVGPATALAMLSMPAMLLGIVVLLPAERRVRYASVGGAAVSLVAVGGFLYAYPHHWNFVAETDYTVEVVATYAVGSAALIASTGAALIAHYLELARSAGVGEGHGVDDEDEDEVSYTDEEIRDDIEAAMEDVELSWGGVEKTDNTRLTFSDHAFEDAEIDVEATTTRSTGVDAQVAGLKGLKGGDSKTERSSSSVDDQTAKLRELREQRREAADEGDGGGSLRAELTGRARSLLQAVSKK